MIRGGNMRDWLQQLLMVLLFFTSSAVDADDKSAYPSYIGEYANKQTSKTTKVDFSRCRQINSHVVVSQSGEWYILSECDIDQPKIKSIRIWRTVLEVGVGLKIHGEIILPWQKLDLLSEHPYLCNTMEDDEFTVVGYIGLNRGKASKRNSLAYISSNDDGTITLLPYTAIDSCDFGESETEFDD
jgi:hypothetical protein